MDFDKKTAKQKIQQKEIPIIGERKTEGFQPPPTWNIREFFGGEIRTQAGEVGVL